MKSSRFPDMLCNSFYLFSYYFFFFCFVSPGYLFYFSLFMGRGGGATPESAVDPQRQGIFTCFFDVLTLFKENNQDKAFSFCYGLLESFYYRAFYHSSMHIFICSFIISMSANFEYILQKITIYLKNDLSTRNRVLTNQPKYSFEQTKNAKQYVKD